MDGSLTDAYERPSDESPYDKVRDLNPEQFDIGVRPDTNTGMPTMIFVRTDTEDKTSCPKSHNSVTTRS